jgi:hypothetical protein
VDPFGDFIVREARISLKQREDAAIFLVHGSLNLPSLLRGVHPCMPLPPRGSEAKPEVDVIGRYPRGRYNSSSQTYKKFYI